MTKGSDALTIILLNSFWICRGLLIGIESLSCACRVSRNLPLLNLGQKLLLNLCSDSRTERLTTIMVLWRKIPCRRSLLQECVEKLGRLLLETIRSNLTWHIRRIHLLIGVDGRGSDPPHNGGLLILVLMSRSKAAATIIIGQPGVVSHSSRRRLRRPIATITTLIWLLLRNDTTNLRRCKHHHFLREALNFKDELYIICFMK